ncbi:MAG: hypothetical protein ABI321_19205 [Polyangia bacterium]
MQNRLVAVSVVALAGACHPHPAPVAPIESTVVATPPRYDQLSRDEFNLRAAERFLPLFWRSDDNANRTIDPSELAVLWGPQHAARADYVDEQGFRLAFVTAYRGLLATPSDAALDAHEQERRALVGKELRGGKPTLVETDLGTSTDEERQMVAHVLQAAALLEKVYARQLGTSALVAQVPKDDAASHALFNRNQSPWCETPQLEQNPACNAIPSLPHKVSGLYPADIQSDPKFCDMLAAQPNGKALMDHFVAVEHDGKGWKPVPYHVAFASEMNAVAVELDAAAAAITSTAEKPLKTYLTAAAVAFRTNDWEPANQAWLQMGGSTSHWYLRIAPDETYYEPCAQKAGFQVSFARLNPDSKVWQDRLAPVKNEMEQALAQLAGPPYRARNVAFKLPDFIDMTVNAGNARSSSGATIGESLPNWGPTAEKGGRTVVMTNLYTDTDSRQALKRQMQSLFCPATDARASTDPKSSLMSTVLHEATHNLGPAHDYLVAGKKDAVVFGGPLASMLEELKAQTGALYFSEWLVQKKLITQVDAEEAHVRDVAWGFGHVSRGMYEADGKPKTYSQLASIQLGSLWKSGGLAWKPSEAAANGTDQGCFDVDFAKWRTTIDQLAVRVLKIKARGDKKDAEALKAAYVDDTGEWHKLRDIIAERWLRAPKASFVYSIK